jgi:hypothetical protein
LSVRIASWESGLSLGLRQGVTRPIREFNSGDFTMYLSVMWNWGGFSQRDLPRGPWPPSVRRRRCNDELSQHCSSLSPARMADAVSI